MAILINYNADLISGGVSVDKVEKSRYWKWFCGMSHSWISIEFYIKVGFKGPMQIKKQS